MRISRLLGVGLAGAALVFWVEAAHAANPRIALVIGEQSYTDAALPTAANDAGLVAEVLQAAGFDVVGARDLDQKSVREALRDFLDKANAAGPDMQAFVYFSGRALQYSGDNYLAPIDAHIARASDAPIEAVKLSDFTHALAAAPGLARVVVIDGARANPYAQQGEPLAGGLALVDPEPNSVIAFNAAPGAIGVPETEGYGVYAKTLAGLLRQGGVDIRDVLAETRLAVNQKTGGAQIPWSAGKLDAPYFLFERAADAPAVVKRAPVKKPLKQLPAEEAYEVVVDRDTLGDYEEFLRDHPRSQQAKRIAAIVAARREALFWRRTLEQNSPRAYWTYLRRYPHGPHAFDADRRLDTLAARREPPPDFSVIEYEDLPPPPPAEIVYADRPVYFFGGDDFGPPPPRPSRDYYVEDDDDWRELPPPPQPTIAGMLPALAIAIPLGLAARAYNGRPHTDGRAPASAPPPAPRPLGPPPLPRGVQVVATPAPVAAKPTPNAMKPATPVPAATPLPTPNAMKPANPVPAATPLPTPNAMKPATPVPAVTPAPTPSAVKPATPVPAATPAPTPNAVKPATPVVTPAPTPNAMKPATPVVTPAPTPTAVKPATPVVTPAPTPTAVKPAAPVVTPLPTPTALKPVAPTPTAAKPAAPAVVSTPTPSAMKPATPLPKPLEAKPVEAPKPAPKAPEPPKPAMEVRPPPRVEAPKPLPPRIEPPKPAPAPEIKPPPRVEAPKPAPEVKPPPKIEPPKQGQKP